MKGRTFTTVWMVGVLSGGCLMYGRHHLRIAQGFWLAAFVVGAGGALFPRQMCWFQRGWMRTVQFVNNQIALILGLSIFLGVLTPMAVIFRLLHRDELRLRPPAGDSYWRTHPQTVDPESYRHLY